MVRTIFAMTHASQRVTVALPDTPYDIHIQPGLLDRAGDAMRALTPAKRVGVVADSNTAVLYLDRLKRSLTASGFDVVSALVPAGEKDKTLETLLPVYDAFLGARFERSMPLIALGGGVTGDMAGFVAATLLRGVPFVQMPTTLLSMVDASVGGKTGVDHPAGKNLIGAFHQPKAVLIDPQCLQTLPERELQSGLAECIKHDIIRDADGFAALEKNIDKALSLDLDYLAGLIAHNVRIKADVVIADPFEHAERAHLNLGHTFGHAIESVSNFAYAHGEAISLGMCAAAYAATKLMMLSTQDHQRITALLRRAKLPTTQLKLDADAIVDAMYFDKKVRDGKLSFVLPDRIGHVVIRDDLPRSLVAEAVESLRGD